MRNQLPRTVAYCLGFFLSASSLYGQVSFFQPPSYAGSGSLFSADFNADGKPDLLSSDGTLQLGNGNGAFTAGTQVPGTPLAVADFNGDGKPDVLETGTGTLLVLLGNGDGTFKAAVTTASGAALQPVASTDLNGDGKADVVGIFGSNLVVYLGKGDGTFTAGVSYSLGVASPGSTVISFADFNGDGKTDVAVSTTGTATGMEIVFLGNGDGTFQAARTSAGVPSSCSPAYAVSGDFTGNGKPGRALDCGFSVGVYGVYILAGNGDGTFQAPTLSIPNVNGPMAAADLNGDGKLDLVVGVGASVSQVFLGNEDGTFSNANNYALNFLPPATPPVFGISIADFNLDGKPDIAVGNSLLIGNGNGTFQGVEVADTSSPSHAFAAVGKFNNQQSVPGVAAALNMDIDILANDGKGGLSLSHTYANVLNAPAAQLVTGDFNGDGNLDLLAVTMDGPTGDWGYCVLLGNGDGSLQPPMCNPQGVQIVNPAFTATSVVAGDFNNDKKLDVAVGGLSNQSLAVLLGKGDGTFAPAAYVFDGGADALIAADFNSDGNLDIAAGGTNQTSQSALLLGNGDGTFQAAVFPSDLSDFAALFTAGLTNDDHADLVSRNQVALGNGDGTFTLGPQLPFFRVGAADFNGDGIPDLLVSPDNTGVQIVGPDQTGVLLGNGDGTFSSTNDYITNNGALQTPLIADMNNDGRPDIVFSIPQLEQGGFSGFGVLLNTTPANFSLSATTLSPSTVTPGNSATATIGLKPNFGFNQTVTLACSGLPSGTTCAFNPASVPGGTAASSSLTISTAGSTAAGTYPIEVQASAGTLTHQVALALVVQAAPDFVITPPSTASQTVGAGQSAMFSLSLAPVGSFSAPISLACAIAPAATPAPACSLSSSSVQFSGAAAQTVTVTVGTTAPVTAMAVRTGNRAGFPTASMPLLALAGLLLHRRRKHLSMLSGLLIMAAFTPLIGCGSGGGTNSHSQTMPGTPSGTYTITVAATSGSLTHNAVLQVIVQ
ncbi:MAG: VCBS repeat-containing protein [Acidobacteriaceae bacterium]